MITPEIASWQRTERPDLDPAPMALFARMFRAQRSQLERLLRRLDAAIATAAQH